MVAGTRPEIIKMAPIIRALNEAKLPSVFVHCGQHYDYNMAQQFIENLELPAPDYALKIEASSPGAQTAEIMMKMDQLLEKIEPSIVLVEGDTNSVLAAALAANKRAIPIGHVEAGLRSFDLRMPEEHNRRLTDHISEYLFAPTETSKSQPFKGECLGQNLPYRQHSHRRCKPALAHRRKEINHNGKDSFQNVRFSNSAPGRKR